MGFKWIQGNNTCPATDILMNFYAHNCVIMIHIYFKFYEILLMLLRNGSRWKEWWKDGWTDIDKIIITNQFPCHASMLSQDICKIKNTGKINYRCCIIIIICTHLFFCLTLERVKYQIVLI